jgi:hypothetical protein
MTFKINKLERGRKRYSKNRGVSYFTIEVNFTPDPEEKYFGTLGEYFSVIAIDDTAAYEAYYSDLENMEYDLVPAGNNTNQIVFKKAGPYELGLCKRSNAVGSETLHLEKDGSYTYSQYLNSNYITEACYKQLKEMKEHFEKGFCRYGDYPDQVGAFRSGDAYHDFIAVLETLDKFWD